MAQHSWSDPARAPHDPRRAPRLAALLALAAGTGAVTAMLALRILDLVATLPSPRFETYLEIPLVGAGAALAAWVSITSALAAACVLARAAGRRWSTGEQLVLRHAPVVVRRLTSAGVAVSIGTGLALGAGSAHAAEIEPPSGSSASPAVVDLGWHSTAQDPSDQTAAALPDPEPSAVPLDVAAPESPGTPPGIGAQEDAAEAPPAPRTTQAARADQPGEHSEQAGQQAAAPPVAGTPAPNPSPPQAGREPVHVPLDGLLGAEQRTLPPQSAAARPGTGTQEVAPRPDASPATAAPDAAEHRASTVSVVVLRGDSLWSLAARSLGEEATDAQIAVEWQRWYAANAQVVGQDPDLIRPGQVLVAPRTL